MIMPPETSAMGRLRFAFFSSALIEVAIIQPSYAKAVATTAPKRTEVLPEAVLKFSIRIESAEPAMLWVKP